MMYIYIYIYIQVDAVRSMGVKDMGSGISLPDSIHSMNAYLGYGEGSLSTLYWSLAPNAVNVCLICQYLNVCLVGFLFACVSANIILCLVGKYIV